MSGLYMRPLKGDTDKFKDFADPEEVEAPGDVISRETGYKLNMLLEQMVNMGMLEPTGSFPTFQSS